MAASNLPLFGLMNNDPSIPTTTVNSVLAQQQAPVLQPTGMPLQTAPMGAKVAPSSPAPAVPSAGPVPTDSTDSKGPVAGDQGVTADALDGMSGDLSDANLKDVLERARSQQNLIQMAKAASQIGGGFAGLSGSKVVTPNNTLYNEQQQMALAPVADLQARIKNQGAMGDLAKQQMSLESQANGADADSDKSQLARAIMKKVAPGIPISDTATSDDIEKFMGPIEKYMSAQQIAQLRAEMASERADAKKVAAGKVDSDKHDQYVKHIEDNEKSWRSDPATTRFDSNLAAVNTADAVLAKYRGHEDDMPIQDIHTLVADKLRAATGVAPTEQEIKAQMPDTFKTQKATGLSWITGVPQAAGAGEYVKNMDTYFQDLEKKSLDGIRNRQKTVASNPKLSKEEQDRLVTIGVPQPVYKKNGGQSLVGTTPPPLDGGAAPHQGKYPPGSTVSVKGQSYTVAPNGDDLLPQ